MKSSASCLHLVVRSSPGAVDRCLAQWEDGDAVLFLDDGVMHIAGDNLDLSCAPASEFFFSAVDLEARGLSGLARAGVLPDADIAELIRAHTFCLTWK